MPVEETMVDGLRVVLVRKPGLPLAAWGVQVASGSAHELPGEEGYAHFLEHMVFKGSETVPSRELTRALDGLGLSSNASTGTLRTCFYVEGLRETVAEGARLLGGVASAPALRPDELDTERGVVLAEFDTGESDPDTILGDAMQRQVFAGHPQGRDILGTRDTVGGASPAGLQGFHARNYVRGNAVAVVVGDLGIDEAATICRRALAGLPAGPAPTPLPPLPPMTPSEGHTPLPVPARNASLATRLPVTPDPRRDAARRVLGSYLGTGLSSPLMTRLREDLGIVYSVSAMGGRDGGDAAFWVDWTARPENEGRVRGIVAEELRRVADGRVEAGNLAGTLLRSRVARARAAVNPRTLLMNALRDLEDFGRVRSEEEKALALDGVVAEDLVLEARVLMDAPWAFHAVGPDI